MTGIAILVWVADGKLKYRHHHTQEQLQADIDRIKETVTPKCWNVFFIAHDLNMLTLVKGEDEL